jgi:hypothetical protein
MKQFDSGPDIYLSAADVGILAGPAARVCAEETVIARIRSAGEKP